MNVKKVALVLAGIVVVALFFYFDLQRFLTLAALKVNRQSLLDYYAAHKLIMVAGFMALYIVQTAPASLRPGYSAPLRCSDCSH